MKALITGASSGIGYSMAKYLDRLGYDLVLVARNKDKLESISKTLKNNRSEEHTSELQSRI